jgi:hypothetical protein
MMKRINQKTNALFKRGDTREDGRLFWKYDKSYTKNGFFGEQWLLPESFNKSNASKVKATKIWTKTNPDKNVAKAMKYIASKLNRTPAWLTKEHLFQIEGFYKLAKQMEKQLSGKYEVDHIVPLQGKEVSGLHVPWNLQILSKTNNIKKSNKYMG